MLCAAVDGVTVTFRHGAHVIGRRLRPFAVESGSAFLCKSAFGDLSEVARHEAEIGVTGAAPAETGYIRKNLPRCAGGVSDLTGTLSSTFTPSVLFATVKVASLWQVDPRLVQSTFRV